MLAVRRRVEDPVPKRDIYSIMYILFFSTVKVANMLVNIVILQWYGMSKGYLLKNWHKKELYISVFFAIIHQQ